tara:strand:+ start:130 stop:777 length:648 start_codon:yes stop_codon:yes gene_type:complete
MEVMIVEKLEDTISGDYITDYDFENSKNVTYRVSKEKLPTEVKDSVNEFLTVKEVVEQRCWYNSHNLSLNTENIDIVNGWYGWKLDSEEIQTLDDSMKESGLLSSRETDSLIVYEDEPDSRTRTTILFDKNHSVLYYRHSWNKSNGIHFDLTTELNNPSFGSRWTYFREFETKSIDDITTTELNSELTQSIVLHHTNGERNDKEVLNRNQLRSSN